MVLFGVLKFPKKDIPAAKDEKNYPDYTDKKEVKTDDDSGSIMSQIIDKHDGEDEEEGQGNPNKYKFVLPYKNSYEMSVDHVSTSSFTSGLRGMCDIAIKMLLMIHHQELVECYNLDNYDSLLVSLSCSKNLIKE